MGLALLFITIYTYFSSIKIIEDCSAHIDKQASTTVNKELLQTHVKIFHPKNITPYVSMKKLQKTKLHP